MEHVLKVGDVLIKGTRTKDKIGRKGYFIVASDVENKTGIVIIKAVDKQPTTGKPAVKKSAPSISSDVEELLDEMRAHIKGKVKPRPLDEFLKTV